MRRGVPNYANMMMKKFRFVIITACMLTVMSACEKTETSDAIHPDITKIRINAGKAAFKTFYPDGRVTGMHMSGDTEQPIVHHEEDTISESRIRKIWTAAGSLPERLRGRNVVPKPEWKSWIQLHLYYSDGRETHLAWPVTEPHQNQKVRDLVRLLLENRTGAW